jgi:hypothetical protein
VVAVVSAPAANRSTRIATNWSSVEIKEFTIIDYRLCQPSKYHQNARVFDCYVSTDSRHPYGYQPCSSSCRPVSLFAQGKLHTGVSQEKRKEASPIP